MAPPWNAAVIGTIFPGMDPRQASLFEDPKPGPAGFAYRSGAIDPDEEAALAKVLADLDLRAFEMRGYAARRRVAYFGRRYDESAKGLKDGPPIPDFLQGLRHKAAALAGLRPEALVHALVNEYPPGAPIGWHRDRPAFGQVIGFSLLSPCVLRFRRPREDDWERRSLTLEPRSAYGLAGEARSVWEHSIPPVEALRYSVTFRTLA
ncbi:alpha-ketoglutarate-dependent dioxygenase AlkB [Caulobacter sp. BK020]|uniref:alpha-ketoglutarate-dependent dioxygenase AlkB n=1 Tax=Caulobacter sp. BK020 TaxID=2512117 RepID=UPI0010E4ECA8|nr:alpha-ketoglutarate-dependent dioxygenase AlkB [Caulobacter sp. BK020]TCS14866.1 alkylated DNA repair dioxygenase AlkB [Caulobacter sp. BK020]